MKQRPRIYYTESQRVLMWERWQKGDSLHQIARLFGTIRRYRGFWLPQAESVRRHEAAPDWR